MKKSDFKALGGVRILTHLLTFFYNNKFNTFLQELFTNEKKYVKIKK